MFLKDKRRGLNRSFRLAVRLVPMVTLLVLASCDHRSSQSEPILQSAVIGQIFVVLENRETVKLSLTDVHIITSETAKSILDDIRSKRQQEINPLYVQEMLDLDALSSSKQKHAGTKAGATEADVIKSLMLLNPNMAGTAEEIARLERIVVEDSGKFKKAARLAPYSDSVRFAEISKITTDADGKFSLPTSDADHVLFVATSRKLGETVERYCWMIRLNSATTNVILANNNMINTDSAENFARDVYRDMPKEPEAPSISREHR
jgi:hypothetical protein